MPSGERVGAVVKVIEVVGSSPNSFSDAVRNAVKIASQSIRNIQGVDVMSSNATVENGELTNYKVDCKIAFIVDSGSDIGSAGADAELATGIVAPQPRGGAKKAAAKKGGRR